MDELSEEETEIVELVREFVDREVRPVVRELEHANTYPEKLIEQMKQLGIFGLAIPEPWGDAKVSTSCYALVTEELARGWMSLAGAMGGHTVVAKLIQDYGTQEQKDGYLPRMATGELRATMALTEPGGGSDLQAMRTTARRSGDSYVVNGSKTWITNARNSGLIALLCKTDPAAEPAHSGHQHPAGRARPGLHGLPRPAQARLQGGGELRAQLRRLRCPGQRAARRAGGRGFRPDDARPGDRPHPGGGAGARGRPGGAGGRAAVRAAAGELRQADLAAPVGRQLPRRHGDQADRGPPAGAARGEEVRRRGARGHGGGHGQAVRLRDGHADRAGRGAHPRRLRLLHRVRRRALLPRRAADDRRRGHQRDPAQRDRAPAGQAAIRWPRDRRWPGEAGCRWPASRSSRSSRRWPRRSPPASSPTSARG